jgi:hypothetical protein
MQPFLSYLTLKPEEIPSMLHVSIDKCSHGVKVYVMPNCRWVRVSTDTKPNAG